MSDGSRAVPNAAIRVQIGHAATGKPMGGGCWWWFIGVILSRVLAAELDWAQLPWAQLSWGELCLADSPRRYRWYGWSYDHQP